MKELFNAMKVMPKAFMVFFAITYAFKNEHERKALIQKAIQVNGMFDSPILIQGIDAFEVIIEKTYKKVINELEIQCENFRLPFVKLDGWHGRSDIASLRIFKTNTFYNNLLDATYLIFDERMEFIYSTWSLEELLNYENIAQEDREKFYAWVNRVEKRDGSNQWNQPFVLRTAIPTP